MFRVINKKTRKEVSGPFNFLVCAQAKKKDLNRIHHCRDYIAATYQDDCGQIKFYK